MIQCRRLQNKIFFPLLFIVHDQKDYEDDLIEAENAICMNEGMVCCNEIEIEERYDSDEGSILQEDDLYDEIFNGTPSTTITKLNTAPQTISKTEIDEIPLCPLDLDLSNDVSNEMIPGVTCRPFDIEEALTNVKEFFGEEFLDENFSLTNNE